MIVLGACSEDKKAKSALLQTDDYLKIGLFPADYPQATCGSTVLWEPHRKPDMIAVAVGVFTDPTFPPPSRQVFEQHRHHWVTISNQDP